MQKSSGGHGVSGPHRKDKATTIKSHIESTFAYKPQRKSRRHSREIQLRSVVSGSVPQSIIAFLRSTDVEDTIRNAISLGGDADTMASSPARRQTFYGDMPAYPQPVMEKLDVRLEVLNEFMANWEVVMTEIQVLSERARGQKIQQIGTPIICHFIHVTCVSRSS